MRISLIESIIWELYCGLNIDIVYFVYDRPSRFYNVYPLDKDVCDSYKYTKAIIDPTDEDLLILSLSGMPYTTYEICGVGFSNEFIRAVKEHKKKV